MFGKKEREIALTYLFFKIISLRTFLQLIRNSQIYILNFDHINPL
jgi:hypothetical protein